METTAQIVEETTKGMSIEISTIISFGIGMVVIMGLICLIAVLTPKMARFLDDFISKHRPERVADENDRTKEVRGIYDVSPSLPEKVDETKQGNDKNNEI